MFYLRSKANGTREQSDSSKDKESSENEEKGLNWLRSFKLHVCVPPTFPLNFFLTCFYPLVKLAKRGTRTSKTDDFISIFQKDDSSRKREEINKATEKKAFWRRSKMVDKKDLELCEEREKNKVNSIEREIRNQKENYQKLLEVLLSLP